MLGSLQIMLHHKLNNINGPQSVIDDFVRRALTMTFHSYRFRLDFAKTPRTLSDGRRNRSNRTLALSSISIILHESLDFIFLHALNILSLTCRRPLLTENIPTALCSKLGMNHREDRVSLGNHLHLYIDFNDSFSAFLDYIGEL